jgi:hypothetical protein
MNPMFAQRGSQPACYPSMMKRLAWIAAWVVTAHGAGNACAQAADQPASPPQAPGLTVEQEVRRNILDQPIGDHHVGDLKLPRAFVDRVTDRVIRESFEQRYRIVVDDSKTALTSPDAMQAMKKPAPQATKPLNFALVTSLAVVVVGLPIVWLAWRLARRGTTQ